MTDLIASILQDLVANHIQLTAKKVITIFQLLSFQTFIQQIDKLRLTDTKSFLAYSTQLKADFHIIIHSEKVKSKLNHLHPIIIRINFQRISSP